MKIEVIEYPKEYRNIIYMAGRNCYGLESSDEATDNDKKIFIEKLIKNNHLSVLEHINICIFIKDVPRSFMEQLTRHRLCSFSIKSTHYVNHSDFKYLELEETLGDQYKQLMKRIQNLYWYYTGMLGIPKSIAREILPNSCLTNIFMTTNVREYRHILDERLNPCNVKIMIDVMKQLVRELYMIMPECFDDIINKYEIE